MKRSILLFIALFIFSTEVSAENRVALLIANGSYKNFASLQGPPGEAEALAATLKKIGFDVKLLENATREQMLDSLDDLTDRIKGKGGIAFFHYGGHGVQVNGKNYLIPVDADIPDERKVSTRAVDVDEVMTSLDASGSDASIIILDACRNNPLPAGAARSASRGLSVITTKPRNSIIIYSAEAGTVAQDGLFTPTLTEGIGKPGLSFTDVLLQVRQIVYKKSSGSQIPGEYNQLFENIFLNGTDKTESKPDLQNASSSINPEPVIGQVVIKTGGIQVSSVTAGTLRFMEKDIDLPAGAVLPINNVKPGHYDLALKYSDGNTETRSIEVISDQTTDLAFTRKDEASLTTTRVAAVKSYNKQDLSGSWSWNESSFIHTMTFFEDGTGNYIIKGKYFYERSYKFKYTITGDVLLKIDENNSQNPDKKEKSYKILINSDGLRLTQSDSGYIMLWKRVK